MQPDPLSQFGKAVQAVAEAAVYPLLVVAAVAALVSAVVVARSYMRERRDQGSARADPAEARRRTMPRNPLLYFHHSAEAAGYPAMLIVSAVALAIALGGIFTVVATDAAWSVGFAMLCVLVAVATLGAAIYAALSENEATGKPEAASVIPLPQKGTSVPREQPVKGAQPAQERPAA
jgi:cytochrome bd-type quinol oxidase subunit 2